MSGHTLILLRHAKSDWSSASPDIERPLARRGRRQAPEAGRWLATNIPDIDVALVSSAVRARSTWELVAEEFDAPPQQRVDDRLYAATLEELLTVVRQLPEDLGTVVMVGHNPGMEDLVTSLTGDQVQMTTSAVVVVDLAGAWAQAGHVPATLRTAGRPPTT
ncbi:MAG TPA: histidine phosphatase family protein [Nocardioidaceae bacterium]|nr:histidine phosphatase family protein [Nocardioidaceae bacterium]